MIDVRIPLLPAVVLTLVLAPALTWPGTAEAQVVDDSPLPDHSPVASLAWMLGEWSGTGWIQMGSPDRHAFDQWERISPALGGLALLVEGRGTLPETGEPIHQALAVISGGAEAGALRFQAWRVEGRGVLFGDHPAELTEDGLIWTMTLPDGGMIRYLIRLLPDGAWHEEGDFSPDGSTWSPFFEMTLRRTAG